MLNRLADEESTQDGGDGEKTDEGARDLGHNREAGKRKHFDVEEEEGHLGNTDAEGPEDLERHGDLNWRSRSAIIPCSRDL